MMRAIDVTCAKPGDAFRVYVLDAEQLPELNERVVIFHCVQRLHFWGRVIGLMNHGLHIYYTVKMLEDG